MFPFHSESFSNMSYSHEERYQAVSCFNINIKLGGDLGTKIDKYMLQNLGYMNPSTNTNANGWEVGNTML